MQDPTLFQQINPQFPEHEQLNCPRCDSKNTKFCYYNNYNLSQPRHYCKNCRRYWTKGGSLRNIPVGGSTRKATKRATSASKKSSPNAQNIIKTVPKSEPFRSFENDQFRSLVEGFGSTGFGKDLILDMNTSSDQNLVINHVGELQNGNGNNNDNNNNNGGEFSGGGEIIGDSSYWGSNNVWPDLAIYTPGSTFQ